MLIKSFPHVDKIVDNFSHNFENNNVKKMKHLNGDNLVKKIGITMVNIE